MEMLPGVESNMPEGERLMSAVPDGEEKSQALPLNVLEDAIAVEKVYGEKGGTSVALLERVRATGVLLTPRGREVDREA